MYPANPIGYFDVLNKCQKAYARHLEPVCKKWSITRNELDVLLFLYNNPEYDRASDIVAHRGIAKSHVSMSVASLEERCLIEKSSSETDRRTIHLKLTEASREIAAEGKLAQEDFFRKLYQGIGKKDFEALAKLTDQVHRNIDNMD